MIGRLHAREQAGGLVVEGLTSYLSRTSFSIEAWGTLS